jgi:hypothetical protein
VNTDDSAFVELFAPRTARLQGFPAPPVPEPTIPDRWIVGSDPAMFRIDGFESGLGTPGGQLPVLPRPPTLPRLDVAYERVRSRLSQRQNAYVAGRLAYAAGEIGRARVLLESVAAADDELGARAAKFAAVAHRSREDQIAALAALPPTTDVLIRLFELDAARAAARVPDDRFAPAADPLGWLLRAAGHPDYADGANAAGGDPDYADGAKAAGGDPDYADGAKAGGGDLAQIEAVLAPELDRTHSLAVLELCVRFAAARDLPDLRARCEARGALRRTERVDWLVERARLAAQRGNRGVALELLEEARGLAPNRSDVDRALENLRAGGGAPAPGR